MEQVEKLHRIMRHEIRDEVIQVNEEKKNTNMCKKRMLTIHQIVAAGSACAHRNIIEIFVVYYVFMDVFFPAKCKM